jgi:hypothetical protein
MLSSSSVWMFSESYGSKIGGSRGKGILCLGPIRVRCGTVPPVLRRQNFYAPLPEVKNWTVVGQTMYRYMQVMSRREPAI